MRYNIVLLPNPETSLTLIKLAEDCSVGVQAGYKLTTDRPPHISVLQFELPDTNMFKVKLDDTEFLGELLTMAQEVWKKTVTEHELSLRIESNMISSKTDIAGAFQGTTWYEIKINKNINPIVQNFHDALRAALPKITPCNASGENYNPHFTLYNTKAPAEHAITEIPGPILAEITDVSVTLAIGKANQQWELVDIFNSTSKVQLDYINK